MATFPGIFRVPHILKERHVGEEYVEEWPSSLQTQKIILRDYVIKRRYGYIIPVGLTLWWLPASFEKNSFLINPPFWSCFPPVCIEIAKNRIWSTKACFPTLKTLSWWQSKEGKYEVCVNHYRVWLKRLQNAWTVPCKSHDNYYISYNPW